MDLLPGQVRAVPEHSRLLGHVDIRTTMGYVHATDEGSVEQ